MRASQQEQHQGPGTGTPKRDTANINAISYTCAFHFTTRQNVCCEKGVLSSNKFPAVIACTARETSKTTMLLGCFLKTLFHTESCSTLITHKDWQLVDILLKDSRNLCWQNVFSSVLCLVWWSSDLVIYPVRQEVLKPQHWGGESVSPITHTHSIWEYCQAHTSVTNWQSSQVLFISPDITFLHQGASHSVQHSTLFLSLDEENLPQ